MDLNVKSTLTTPQQHAPQYLSNISSHSGLKSHEVFESSILDTHSAPFHRLENHVHFEKNTTKSLFLKQYLEKRLQEKGFVLPSNFQITTYSKRPLDLHTKEMLRLLLFKEYHGFVNSFFELMGKPQADFDTRLKNLKAGPELIQVLKTIYGHLENFYQIDLNILNSNKHYNLLKLTQKEQEELLNTLNSTDHKALKIILKETDNLKQMAGKFARSEMRKEMLYEAGEESRDAIFKLVVGVIGLSIFDKYIKGDIVSKLGEGTKAGKTFDKATEFIAGGGDDVIATYKDYFQDKIILGDKIAKEILAGGTIVALLTSGLGAKYGTGTLPKALGYAYSTSGGTVYSNVLTLYYMYKNYDKLEQNGFFSKPPEGSSFQQTQYKLKVILKNYIDYDAYWGKILGFISLIPLTLILHAAGALKKNKASTLVYITALQIIGSAETYIAVATQLARDKIRQQKMDKAKEEIINGKASVADYNENTMKI